jgi:hypothetical protein
MTDLSVTFDDMRSGSPVLPTKDPQRLETHRPLDIPWKIFLDSSEPQFGMCESTIGQRSGLAWKFPLSCFLDHQMAGDSEWTISYEDRQGLQDANTSDRPGRSKLSPSDSFEKPHRP